LEEIADDDELYRRLAPDHVNADGTVNSAAFKRRGQPDPQVSVDLARLTTRDEILARAPRPGFGLGVLVARAPRALGLTVRHDPLPGNPAHSLIEGQTNRTQCRLLAEATIVLVQPQQFTPPGA
jgi:hypothetical protein